MKQQARNALIQPMLSAAAMCALATGIFIAQAQAAPLIFFGEDVNLTNNPTTPADDPSRLTKLPLSDGAKTSFLSYLASTSTENFESYGAGQPRTLTFGNNTALLQGGPNIGKLSNGTFNGTYPTSGDQFLLHWGNAGIFELQFNTPQVAFGFFGTDIGDGSADLVLTFSGDSSNPISVPHATPTGSGSVLYFGIIDAEHPFTTVSFKNTNWALDAFGFDDMTIGQLAQAVPEPSAFALLGFGLLALLRYPRRLRRNPPQPGR